jgi:hypothetical protein
MRGLFGSHKAHEGTKGPRLLPAQCLCVIAALRETRHFNRLGCKHFDVKLHWPSTRPSKCIAE